MFGKKKGKKLSPKADELKQISQDNLYHYFTNDKWDNMDNQGRLAVLQEIENRRAAADGRRPLTVKIGSKKEFSDPDLYGYHSDHKKEIHLNYRWFTDKAYRFGGASALETLLHEGRHAYQTFLTQNNVENDSPDILKEWLSSDAAYIDGGVLYALQSIEDDARRFARRELTKIMNNLLLRGINCPEFFYQYQEILQREDYFIRIAKEYLTLDDLNHYEDLILQYLKEMRPDMNIDDISLFDGARLILDTDLNDTSDLINLLEKLDQMADAKLGKLQEKNLNRMTNLNKMR